MEKKKISFKKPVIIAAAVAAVAGLTVSVGAATNWDIASLFVSKNAETRELPPTWFRREFREYYANENFTVQGVSSETEYDILQAISSEVDRDFEIDDHNVHIFGYAYDGNVLEVLYEISCDEDTADDITPLYTMVMVVPDGRYDLRASEREIFCTPGKYRARFDIRIPENNGSVRLYIADVSEKEKIYTEGMAYKSENYVDITLNRNNVYSYNSENEIEIGDGFTVTNLSISPFIIRLEGKSPENAKAFDKPIIAAFSDGSVIDLHRRGSGAGMYEFYSLYTTLGVLLDAREITELRIGDTTIPLK